MILHYSLLLFYRKTLPVGCQSRWENLDRGQYPFQPIKFVNVVVPSPHETEPLILINTYIAHIREYPSPSPPPGDKPSTLASLILKELHWLPMEQRITFKVLLLTFKALNNLVPPYISQLIVPYNSTRNLRSAGKLLLEVPNVRLKSYGSRAFSVNAPKHWNEIPLDIKLSRSVDVFKSRLKTYLFRLAFNRLFVLLLLLVRYLLDCKAI